MLWLTLKLNPRPQLGWNLMKQKCYSKELIKISSKWEVRFEEWQPGYYFSSHQRFLNMLQKCCTSLRGWEVMKHTAVLVPLCWMINRAVAFGKGSRVIRMSVKYIMQTKTIVHENLQRSSSCNSNNLAECFVYENRTQSINLAYTIVVYL